MILSEMVVVPANSELPVVEVGHLRTYRMLGELTPLWPLRPEVRAEIPTVDQQNFMSSYAVRSNFPRDTEFGIIRTWQGDKRRAVGFVAVGNFSAEEVQIPRPTEVNPSALRERPNQFFSDTAEDLETPREVVSMRFPELSVYILDHEVRDAVDLSVRLGVCKQLLDYEGVHAIETVIGSNMDYGYLFDAGFMPVMKMDTPVPRGTLGSARNSFDMSWQLERSSQSGGYTREHEFRNGWHRFEQQLKTVQLIMGPPSRGR